MNPARPNLRLVSTGTAVPGADRFPAPRGFRPVVVDGGAAAWPSPARGLQAMVAGQFEDERLRGDATWPPLATLGFVVLTCAPVWLGALGLVSRLG